MTYETVIGLEVHLQLATATKIFCGCPNSFGAAPNSCVCPVCLGLPGSLPVLNRRVLASGIRVGLALHCEINPFVKFDRKNYFYPDLPKGYQISQYDFPIARDGWLEAGDGAHTRRFGIVRAHLEEDAGKLIHDSRGTLVDYNRAGTPLVEIVSAPDMRSAQQAHDYLTALKLLLQYLDVSDCDMEKGSLRCDANVSIRPVGETRLGTKTEIKNLNSFSAVKRAIDFEAARQSRLLAGGGRVVQETLLWDDDRGQAAPMRGKEDAHDYRYFPEPDLVPFTLAPEIVAAARAVLPEAPRDKYQRFMSRYALSAYDAGVLVQQQDLADFFERTAALFPTAKKVCNWLTGPVMKELNERRCRIGELKISPEHLALLITRVEEGHISNLAGKEILTAIIATGEHPDACIQARGLDTGADDAALEAVVEAVITANPGVVAQIRSGKTSASGFLVGQAMKQLSGKANPKKIDQIIQRRIVHG